MQESHRVIAFPETSPFRDATKGSLNGHFHTLRDAKYNIPGLGATLHYAVAFQLLGPIQCAMADGPIGLTLTNVCDSTKLGNILWLIALAQILSNVLC